MVDASVSGFSRWRLTRLWNRVGEGGGGFSSEMPVLGASGGFATMAEGPAPGAAPFASWWCRSLQAGGLDGRG
jgi:hypothetical protein